MRASDCYYCGAPATGMDHVPPLAFFPEAKDLPVGAPDYRRDLVTVPSCTAHNNARSGDDQVAAYAVLAHEGVNPVGLHHQATKVHRATRRDGTLASRVLVGLRASCKDDGRPGIIARIDMHVLKRVLERIARGLYFHDTGDRWTTELKIVSGSMLAADQSQPYREPAELIGRGMANSPWHGHNPDVFRYQWFSFRDSSTRVLRMVFYGGFEFVAVPRDATTVASPHE